jgi:hypothetical protein
MLGKVVSVLLAADAVWALFKVEMGQARIREAGCWGGQSFGDGGLVRKEAIRGSVLPEQYR